MESFQVIRATDGEPWGNLYDRDTFDWSGLGVTLGAPGRVSFVVRKYFEVFDVDVNTTFGPWRECDYSRERNDEACTTALPEEMVHLVSRKSAEGLTGERGSESPGQCEANEMVGSWFVFPSQGMCGENEAVGDGGCTWKMKGSKVVSHECLFYSNNGLKDWTRAWAEDYQKPPFPNVVVSL